MGKTVLWLVCSLFLLYGVAPWSASLFFGMGVFRKGRTQREIAFTFDDGPDPEYTPRLLELLKQSNQKATFFVLGWKAKKYPDLIRRIHEEGHLIGIHHYRHWPNWFSPPWKVRRQLVECQAIIAEITGERPVLYRPPWGLFTWSDLLQKQFRLVLWSVMAGDWWRYGGSRKIRRRLLNRIKGGSVILLHDSGTTWGAHRDAPSYMLAALTDIFAEIQRRGYRSVRVDELIGFHQQRKESRLRWRKRMLIRFWMTWEKLFRSCFRIVPIDEKNRFLHLRVRTYRGKAIRLTDGGEIRKGDRIAELHFDNEVLFQMATKTGSSLQLAIQMIRATEQLLPHIARFLLNQPKGLQIKGLYGVSIIHRGTSQFGFTVTDLPKGVFAFVTKLYLRLLLSVVHPEGKQRLYAKTDLLIPKVVAISSNELIKKYSLENV